MWEQEDLLGQRVFRVTKWKEYPFLVAGVTSKDMGSLALHVGDPEVALNQREIVANRLGFPLEYWVAGEQVHKNGVQLVSSFDRGRGALSYSTSIPGTDGLITGAPGVLLTSFYGDCVPLMVLHAQEKKMGLAHAGWRGTALGIAKSLVAAFGCPPCELSVAIGPCIRSCCYEVGPEMKDIFPHAILEKKGRLYLDLVRANKEQLLALSIREDQIFVADYCTCCDATFFSYRREGSRAGRFMSFMGNLEGIS